MSPYLLGVPFEAFYRKNQSFHNWPQDRLVKWLKMSYTNQLKNLPTDYAPWFDVCHFILCVLAVRKEAGRGFAWSHPFSAWLSCVVASFAGSIVCNPLLGKY